MTGVSFALAAVTGSFGIRRDQARSPSQVNRTSMFLPVLRSSAALVRGKGGGIACRDNPDLGRRPIVGVHGAETSQQLLNAGLLDELHIDGAALLLGSGVRLFDHLAITPAVLDTPRVIEGVGVTHMRYSVRKG